MTQLATDVNVQTSANGSYSRSGRPLPKRSAQDKARTAFESFSMFANIDDSDMPDVGVWNMPT